jgi:hypothetical protein
MGFFVSLAWRLGNRFQPEMKVFLTDVEHLAKRHFGQPRPRSGPGSADRAEAKMPIKGTSLTRQPLYEMCAEIVI